MEIVNPVDWNQSTSFTLCQFSQFWNFICFNHIRIEAWRAQRKKEQEEKQKSEETVSEDQQKKKKAWSLEDDEDDDEEDEVQGIKEEVSLTKNHV